MSKKQKLELTWVGKDQRPNLEPRILVEDPAVSYHAGHRSKNEQFDNRLIFGDNLLALKALESQFRGQLDCIYIDPPYNTGAAFTHFDDSVEHSLWLSLIRERVVLLWRMLADHGSLWVSIDDSESAYLRILLDEICGRAQFIACNVWQKRYSRENREAIGDVHEYVVVYAKSVDLFKSRRNRVPMSAAQAAVYKNPNKDPNGRWRPIPMTAQGYRPNQMYPITDLRGGVHHPPEGRCWSMIEPEFMKLRQAGRVWFGKDGRSQPNIIRYLSEVEGLVPWTWWPSDEVGHTDEAKKEMHNLFGRESAFATPKPERLLERILTIATNPGDIVLDSFAGSGTTGAVAHKMGRRWIMIEMGEHAHTHIIPRLKKVIDGDDPGGITEAVGWKGGGGFRYYRLAPSLITTDAWGNPVINREYNAAMLAEALCKLEGFTYAPSETVYWQQGRSTERDFLYVTTANLGPDQLRQLSDDVGSDRTLLVLCTAFRGSTSEFPNLTVRKIPTHVLDRCEWGRDDYSLAVADLPPAPPPPGQQSLFAEEPA